MMNTIEIHRKQPNITLAQHIQNKRLQLGKEISKKYKIYLDLRFWFFLEILSLGIITIET
ncbi:hypothetical protein EB629_09855 [Escherichia coli]|nr:hypothetical protein HMPREF9543_00733 [Escherichia coli MS 146-1]EFN7232170.1 hypothetical protein [Escherichia coli O26:H32]EFN8144046.1 hypothetical protein [Escherichia coli]EFN9893312.1 hypothetical protein [Escherichia coli]EFO0504343.1 hypothetical protein [Escherichia coli]